MFEQLQALVAAGRWAEIRQIGPMLLADLAGDQHARGCLYISTAYHNTAAGSDDWQEALQYARTCLATATPGGLVHTWALQKVTSLLVDMGRLQAAKPYALAYLVAAHRHPKLAHITPYVVRALSQIAYRERRFVQAAMLRRRVLSMFRELGSADEILRSQISLAWAYARAGRPALAREALPEATPAHLEYLFQGARSVILAAEGRWSDAYAAGRLALTGGRATFDFADAAEVCLIMALAARQLGAMQDALALIQGAATLAARQAQSAFALMVLILRAEGGAFTHAAAASRGSGGWHPESRFTTGLA